MFLAFVTFLFLYAVIWLFERKRRRVDAYRVGVAAIVPVALMLLVAAVTATVFQPSVANMAVASIVLAVTTFFMLWKVVDIPPLRCIAYVAAVIVFHIAFGAGIVALGTPEQTLYGDWEGP